VRICAHARVRDHLITTGKVLIRHIHASESRVIQKPYNHCALACAGSYGRSFYTTTGGQDSLASHDNLSNRCCPNKILDAPSMICYSEGYICAQTRQSYGMTVKSIGCSPEQADSWP
jgi:hypothetical protein